MHTQTWPFPSNPPIPWDKKQQEEYDRNQRNKLPNAPMCYDDASKTH